MIVFYLTERQRCQVIIFFEILIIFKGLFILIRLFLYYPLQVWRMSHDFLYKEWKKVGELYGVGRYAEDAFRMFCLGDFSVKPKDRYLKIYKAWYEMQDKKARLKEMND